MAQGRANLRRIPPGLTDAMTALLSFVPAGPGQQATQERAVIAVEQALDARRHRIVLSQAIIAPIQWLVIFLLDVRAPYGSRSALRHRRHHHRARCIARCKPRLNRRRYVNLGTSAGGHNQACDWSRSTRTT